LWWLAKVVMPEHIHLLLSEPDVGAPSTVIQVLKQRSARALLAGVKCPRAEPLGLDTDRQRRQLLSRKEQCSCAAVRSVRNHENNTNKSLNMTDVVRDAEKLPLGFKEGEFGG
jgi:REP element-mobilizing transposase RayT